MQQQQQSQVMGYGAEAYANYAFPGSMAQFNTYDFQTTYPPPPPATNFGLNMASCPAPPGLSDWQPQLSLQENEEEMKRREGKFIQNISKYFNFSKLFF